LAQPAEGVSGRFITKFAASFMMARMRPSLPLHSLLSQVLIAFTIEFDNEFEHQVPHRTTDFGSTPGAVRPPFLISMVMWLQFLRFIPNEGIPLAALKQAWQLSGNHLKSWLTRMSRWWRYITLEKAPDGNLVIRPTPGGLKAFQVWRGLTVAIEQRWRQRLGEKAFDELIEALRQVADGLAADLPGVMPILGYGLFGAIGAGTPHKGERTQPAETTLPALLARTLLAYAIEFEQDSEVSLAIAANVLRFFEERLEVPVREIPGLACVSKEAIAMATGFLEKRGLATVKSEVRTRILVLTPEGRRKVTEYLKRVAAIEARWRADLGGEPVDRLRRALERVVEDADAGESPLQLAIKPYPDGWRAKVPAAAGLAHFPMVLHRGGFPDGS
jgi:DNA-binding MarR family transcriptional regulator